MGPADTPEKNTTETGLPSPTAPRSGDTRRGFALSRRAFGGLIGLAALGPLLEACGATSGTTTSASAKPTPGGTVTFAIDSEPTSWDIHVSPQDITGEIQRNVFDSLIAEDANGTFHPWLATSWDVAPDLTSYTFHLRTDVTFTDGTPFDANAVKANFDRIVAPATKSQFAANLLGPYTGTQVLDAHTAKVTFSAPYAPFLQAASTSYLGFYSPKAIAANSGSLGSGGPVAVGTGPFVFSSYTKGQSATFTRNPAYNWAPSGVAAHTGPAYLDQLTVRFLSEDSVRVGALTSGQVGVARSLPPNAVASLSRNRALTVQHRDDPGAPYALYLNTTAAPLDDITVRKAILRGINIDLDVKTLYFGQYDRAWSLLTPPTPDYDPALENSWPYDQNLANSLLDQAGWTGRDSDGYRTKNGRRLSISWAAPPAQYIREQRDVLAQAIQADLKKIGVELNRQQLNIADYTKAVYSGTSGIVDFSWARFEPDTLWLFFNSENLITTKKGENASQIKDPQLDQWTEQARQTLDPTIRRNNYAQTQARIMDLALAVPLYVPRQYLGVAKSVNGLVFDPNAWSLFYDVWVAK